MLSSGGRCRKRLCAFFATQHVVIFEPDEKQFYRYEPKSGLYLAETRAEIRQCFIKLIQHCARRWTGYRPMVELCAEHYVRGTLALMEGAYCRRDFFNQPLPIVHLANCVLDFSSGSLEVCDFSPDYRSRNASPIRYDPDARAPKFKQAMLSHLQEDDQRLIQKHAGQCLLGFNITQTFLLLDGASNSSKSTLVLLLAGLIGENNCGQLRTWLLERPFETARFVGKTLLTGIDAKINFLSHQSASMIKALIGGDRFDTERKGSTRYSSFEGTFNLIVTANELPPANLQGDEDAWRRRVLRVHYDKPFEGKSVYKFYRKLLKEEGSGILNWAVEGLQNLLEDIVETGQIKLSERQRELVNDFLLQSDSLRVFLRSELVGSKGSDLSVEEITHHYIDYCVERHWNHLSIRTIEKALPDLMRQLWATHRSNDIQCRVYLPRGRRAETKENRASVF